MRRIIFARDGGLSITAEKDSVLDGFKRVLLGSTAKEVAENLVEINESVGIDMDDLYLSSTMHFASEEGFENDEDAINLLDSALLKLIE